MNLNLKRKLLKITQVLQTKTDPSHDFQHILRVTNMAEIIGKKEKADMDILIPAALFHDIIVYKKNSNKSKKETLESAQKASKILRKITLFPKNKIEKVALCIEQCSFSKDTKPELLETKILQDADRLEACGAISIMRTFSSGGQMNISFYNPEDPFCEKKSEEFKSDLDLFYRRLLIVSERMHTKYAKKIAHRRTIFLKKFLAEFHKELKETKIHI